jgi:TolB-like protein
MAITPQVLRGKGRKLDSWKAIADYLDRDVRSVQRWEHARGLPVYRVPGAKSGGVFAYTDELDEWLHQRRDHSGEDDRQSVKLFGDLNNLPPVSSSAALPDIDAVDLATTPRFSKRFPANGRIMATLAGVIILCAVVALIATHPWRQSVKPPSGRLMLAVLPFLNLSGDPTQDYFADGLTEEMITDLGKLNPEALGVIARTSAMTYKQTKKNVGQIGRELHVSYVLEGSVRREGNVIRISAQLIQVSDQTHLWAQNYERDVKDIIGVQRDVAQAIAQKIQVKLSPRRQTELADSRPANPQAYDDYLKGLYLWNERSVASMSKGAKFFEQATVEDPSYAAAYAGMARCYALISMEGVANSRELLGKAKAAAARAVELDSTSAEAHVALGGTKVFSDFDWSGSEAEFKLAIELNPNDAEAHHWYANLYLDPRGQYEEAIAEIKRAQELDPLSLIINTDLGYAYYVAGFDDAASSQFHKVLEMDPGFVPAQYDLSMLHLKQKMSNAPLEEKIAELRISGPSRLLSKVEELSGQKAFRGAEQEHLASQELSNDPKSVWEMALAYLYLGDKSEALSSLEAAYQQRNPAIIYIKCDPFWNTLRSESRFQDLERKLGM